MKIQSLTLDHFSSHKATTITFDKPVTLIVGALNSGKSSCAQALEFALTGQVDRYRGARSVFTDLLFDKDRTDDSRFTVTLKTDAGTVKRGKNMLGKSFVSWDGQTDNAELMALAAWKTTKPLLSALLGTGEFFELEEKEQKELILRLVGAEVSRKIIESKFQSQYGSLDALQLLKDRDIESVSAIDAAYTQAFETRTIINRDLRELKPGQATEGKELPIEGIRAKIRELEAELGKASTEVGRLEERVKSGGAAERRRLDEKIQDLAGWLEKTSVPSEKQIKQTLSEAHAKQKAVDAWTNSLRQQMIEARAQQMLHESNAATLSKFNGRCVAGPHDCPASTEVMIHARDLEKEACVTAGNLVIDIGKKIESQPTFRGDILEAERELANLNILVAEIKSKQEQRSRTEKLLSEVKDGPSQTDMEELNTAKGKVTVLRERIEVGRKRLEEAFEWQTAAAAVQKVAARRAMLEKQSRQIESLCEFFGPKGVKVSLIEDKISAFETLVNTGLLKFGFSFKFTAYPWRIVAKDRPVDRLSRSERYRLGVALQVAIARVTGVNLVVCDDAEHLTPDARGAMLKLLLESEVQALVIMTSMKPEAEFLANPPKGPFLVLWVRNVGGVSEVQAL